MKRMLPRLIIGMIVVFATFFGWHWFTAQRETHAPLVLHGNVEIRQVELAFRVGGRLSETLKQEGEAVRAGDVLARLDAAPYENEVRAAHAQVLVQEALLRKVESGFRFEEVEQARAALAEADSSLSSTRSNYDRIAKLRRGGGVSQQDLEDALARHQQAQARREVAATQLNMLESGARQEDVEAQKATLQAAEAMLAKTQTALDDTVLIALSNGIILTRVREPGAIVQPGQSVYVLSLTQPVYIRAFVPQPQLGLVKPGAKVWVEVDAMPGKRYAANIGHISTVAEFTPKTVETSEVRNDLVFRVRIIVEDTDNVMRQGMPVSVYFAPAAESVHVSNGAQ